MPGVNRQLAAILIPVATFLVGSTAIAVWLGHSQNANSVIRIPGADRPADAVATSAPAADLSGKFVAGEGRPGEPQGEWSTFRGSGYDAIARESGSLIKSLDGIVSRKLWQVGVGEGYAGPVIRGGRAYLLDYDAGERADVLRCLSMADGKDIWRRSYRVDVKRNHGMSRTVPAVTDKYVVTIGPKCHLLCVDAQTGDYKWGIDLVRQYRTKVPPWYAGQCPVIDEGRAIIAPGGSSLMIAVDCETGKVIWETPNPRGWDMTHTSIIPMESGGVKMFVYAGSGGVAGVDAATGKLLWETTAWRVKIAAVPSPVPLGDGRILLTGGYDAGAMMVRLLPSGEGFNVETLWTAKPAVFGAEQQTPIFFDGSIYGIIPGGQMVCLDPATGKQRWNSGGVRFGIGPYMIADGVIWVTNDKGDLSAVAADDQRFSLLSAASVIDSGHEAWGPMALAGGRLLVRDLTRMVCLNLRAGGE